MELQNLQQQLKVAIQSHQNVVSKMKADPQNTVLQKQLHELQAEIKTLSEKQKQVVQQLRKEIEIKQHHIQQGNDVNHESITAQSTPLPLVKTSELLSLKTLPFTTTATNTTLAPKVNCEQNKNIHGTVHTNSPVHLNKNSANDNNNSAGMLTNALNLTPAIRVPQYPPPCLRPSITQPQMRSACLTLPSMPRSQVLSPVLQKETQLPKINNNNNIVNNNINNNSNSANNSSNNNNNNNNNNNTNNNNNNDIYLKVDFMAALGLITHDTLSELQNRRSERKRRTTANPQFSYGNWELSDKRRKPNNYLTSPLPLNFRKPRGRPRLGSTPNNSCPATPDDGSSNKGSPNDGAGGVLKNGASTALDEICSVCQNQGDLLHCDTCMLSYHRTCVDCSPVDSMNPSSWVCPKCQLMRKTPLHWPGSLAMVHSYIAHKAAKEEEKRKLIKRSLELKSERGQLELKAKQLSETIELQMHKRNELVLCIQHTQESIDVLKKLIKHFQGS